MKVIVQKIFKIRFPPNTNTVCWLELSPKFQWLVSSGQLSVVSCQSLSLSGSHYIFYESLLQPDGVKHDMCDRLSHINK